MKKLSKAYHTKEKILTSGWNLFQKKGFEQTSMRDIAHTAQVATGAAYYYFNQKEDIVLELYTRIQNECEIQIEKIILKTKDFEKRFYDIVQLTLKQLQPYRKIVRVVAEKSMNMTHSISPFSTENKDIRNRAIKIMNKVIKSSNIKVHSSLLSILPTILWLYQMAIILLWIYDSSINQKKTQQILKMSLKVVCILLKISTLPVPGKQNLLRMVNNISVMSVDIIEKIYKRSYTKN